MLNRTTDGTPFTVSGDDSDPAVVLIHGLGLDHTTWDGHHAALAERYRVIRYDLFGHGQSALPVAR